MFASMPIAVAPRMRLQRMRAEITSRHTFDPFAPWRRRDRPASVVCGGVAEAKPRICIVVDACQTLRSAHPYKETMQRRIGRCRSNRIPTVVGYGGVPMRLQELMSTNVATIGPDETADAAWAQMRRRRIRHLVVTDGARMVGVLSERDVGGRGGAALRRGRSVRELMTASPASATPTTTLRQAANLMRGRLIGSIPVIEDGRVVGIVTATDVLDELGRGSIRPVVRAQRQSMRMPPASARRASAKQRVKRAARQAKSPAGSRSGSDTSEPPPDAIAGRNTATPGRARVRQVDGTARASLVATTSRATKRAGLGRAPAEIPVFIRAAEPGVDADGKAYLRRKLGRRLGKFAPDVQRVSVRLDDINGPRGGVDWQCRIKVTLRGLPSVMVESLEPSMQAARDRALAMVGNTVQRTLEHRRVVLRRPSRDRRAPAVR
ncbi:MAG: CBS domain-containing protein [Proteobacteria bacterium]|nr:CBS domain-containing protein [Pseudomonadota bacterium]